jgi:hypothetical protein
VSSIRPIYHGGVSSLTAETRPPGLSPQRRKSIGTLAGLLVSAPALLIVMGVAIEGHPLPIVFPADAPTVAPLQLLVDSPFSLAAMVLASLIMTSLLIARPTRVVAVLGVVFCLFFAFFDAVELISKAQAGLVVFVVIAVAALALRAVTTVLCLRLARA